MSEVLFLFGAAGAGKNWVAERLRDRFGYHFYDADVDLTPAMRGAIHSKSHFTDEMRDEFFAIIARRTQTLRQLYPKLVVAQAAYKQRQRDFIAAEVSGVRFILVRAPGELNDADEARVVDQLEQLRAMSISDLAVLTAARRGLRGAERSRRADPLVGERNFSCVVQALSCE